MSKDKKKQSFVKPGTAKRLLKYIFSHYRLQMIIVIITIILSAVSTVVSNVFL